MLAGSKSTSRPIEQSDPKSTDREMVMLPSPREATQVRHRGDFVEAAKIKTRVGSKPVSTRQSMPTPKDRYSQLLEQEHEREGSRPRATPGSRRRLLDDGSANDAESATKKQRLDLPSPSFVGPTSSHKQPSPSQQASHLHPSASIFGISSLFASDRHASPAPRGKSNAAGTPDASSTSKRPSKPSTSAGSAHRYSIPSRTASVSSMASGVSRLDRRSRQRSAHHVEECWPDKEPEEVIGVSKNDEFLYMLVRWCVLSPKKDYTFAKSMARLCRCAIPTAVIRGLHLA